MDYNIYFTNYNSYKELKDSGEHKLLLNFLYSFISEEYEAEKLFELSDKNTFLFVLAVELTVLNYFTKEDLVENLNSENPIPFIDTSLDVEGFDLNNHAFCSAHINWDEFGEKTKESFLKRLNNKSKTR